ncbi:MAG: hypothetical protein ACLR0U_03725 [Enterocloster clostridioformis]
MELAVILLVLILSVAFTVKRASAENPQYVIVVDEVHNKFKSAFIKRAVHLLSSRLLLSATFP